MLLWNVAINDNGAIVSTAQTVRQRFAISRGVVPMLRVLEGWKFEYYYRLDLWAFEYLVSSLKYSNGQGMADGSGSCFGKIGGNLCCVQGRPPDNYNKGGHGSSTLCRK